jgi:hypothetical protein
MLIPVKNSLDIADQMNSTLMLDAASRGDLELAEKYLLKLPENPLKVVHLFGPGFCIREMHIPAGSFIIGHAHKQSLSNILQKGRMKVYSNGVWSLMEAPLFFIGVPGRKAAIALEDSIWQNILITDETDPDRIEDLFVTHSEEYQQFKKQKQLQGELL